MSRQQRQRLTRVLAAVAAGAGLLYLLMLAGFGRGVPGVREPVPEPVPELALTEAQVDLPPLDRFPDLAQRPLFAEDRRPEPKETPEAPEPVVEQPPTAPLNAVLTGVIHTPRTRIALLRDNSNGQNLRLSEGMPMPGDQGGWVVKTVEPRRVVFEDAATSTEETLELAIGGGAAIPAPPPLPQPVAAPAMARPGQAAAEAVGSEEDEVARRAAEIRRRIEERRAQLRREAEQSKQ
ncbi:MAG: hypothetical protein KF823_07590 [Xanthomonadales bacterium]|nr:hypothetical protein [Xanthomonadales bacterium]